jgi:hypothetical protein
MRVWLRLTHLFGLPDGHRPDNLMQAALGPVLRSVCGDVVDASLPEPIARLARELAQREWPFESLEDPRSLAPTGHHQGQRRPRHTARRKRTSPAPCRCEQDLHLRSYRL